MNSLQRSLALTRICTRFSSSQASGPSLKALKKLKEKQARFQQDDGLPVYLKGGFMDRLLFQTTVALCGVGLVMAGKLYYDLAVPKK